MARRDQQMRDHPDRVGSAAAGGEEAESGDLDGVPLGKEQGIGGLVEYVLPHALAEGAFPDDQAAPVSRTPAANSSEALAVSLSVRRMTGESVRAASSAP